MRIGTWAVGPHLHVMQTRTQGTPRRHRDRLNTLAAGDRGIRTTVTGHVTPSEWLSPKKENIKSAKNKPERGCLPGRGGRGRNDAAALKASLRALQKAKRDPGTAALRVDPMLAGARVTAAKSCDRPECPPTGTWYVRAAEWGSATRGNDGAGDGTEGPRLRCAECSWGPRNKHSTIPPVPGAWGRAHRESLFHGDGVLVWEDGNVLEIEMLVTQPPTVEHGSFTLSYFTTIKKKWPRTQN